MCPIKGRLVRIILPPVAFIVGATNRVITAAENAACESGDTVQADESLVCQAFLPTVLSASRNKQRSISFSPDGVDRPGTQKTPLRKGIVTNREMAMEIQNVSGKPCNGKQKLEKYPQCCKATQVSRTVCIHRDRIRARQCLQTS